MPGVLTANVIGHLGGDPDTRYTNDGSRTVTFSVAVNNGTKDKPHTEWVRVTAWRKLGEICAKYLAKGALVYVEGRLSSRSYEATDGAQRFSLDLNASNVQILSKIEGSAPAPTDDDDLASIPF